MRKGRFPRRTRRKNGPETSAISMAANIVPCNIPKYRVKPPVRPESANLCLTAHSINSCIFMKSSIDRKRNPVDRHPYLAAIHRWEDQKRCASTYPHSELRSKSMDEHHVAKFASLLKSSCLAMYPASQDNVPILSTIGMKNTLAATRIRTKAKDTFSSTWSIIVLETGTNTVELFSTVVGTNFSEHLVFTLTFSTKMNSYYMLYHKHNNNQCNKVCYCLRYCCTYCSIVTYK